MDLHIRALELASNALTDFLRLGNNPPTVQEDEERRELEVLVKNALITEDHPRPDVPRVWKELRGRVKGPFGKLALEGPAFAASEHVPSVPQQARDGLAPSADYSCPLPAAEEVHSTAMYRGSDSHQMNLR